MLRMLSFVVAVAAILVIPLSQADARGRGGGHGGHSFSGHFSGGRAFVGGGRAFVGRGFVGRRAFIGRRRFFGGPIFVAGGGCWRWRPTVYGWARVWVCGPWYG